MKNKSGYAWVDHEIMASVRVRICMGGSLIQDFSLGVHGLTINLEFQCWCGKEYAAPCNILYYYYRFITCICSFLAFCSLLVCSALRYVYTVDRAVGKADLQGG